ncbi:hypothetical protein D3C81_2277000 [compost metagenome]
MTLQCSITRRLSGFLVLQSGHVVVVVAPGIEEHGRRQDADQRHQLEGVVQADQVGHLAGDQRPGGQAE